MLRRFIEFAQKGQDLVRILRAVLAGIEAFQAELKKGRVIDEVINRSESGLSNSN